MEKEFLEKLRKSGWIHSPLELEQKNSIEEERRKKEVWKRRKIWAGPEDGRFQCPEQGTSEIIYEEGFCVHIEGNLKEAKWPKGMPQDGDCAYYGNLRGVLNLGGQDWQEYTRLRFQVRPTCPGLHVISLSVYLKNQGKERVPDRWNRTGQHMLNLENGQWKDCIWEFGELGRDCVTEVEFRYRLSGSDTGSGKKAAFDIKQIFIEKAEGEKEKGWELEKNTISYDFCGYFPWEKKTALAEKTKGGFQIVREDTGEKIMEKEIIPLKWQDMSVGLLDFTELREEGRYRIITPEVKTESFQIGKDWSEEMIWKGLNFIFCQRCGYLVPGKHGNCHEDCYAIRGKELISYGGGWHDAGDMSQQTVQTAELTEELFMLAQELNTRQELYCRLMEEALWGLSFLLKTRFQEGFRAFSLGLIRWTDGKIGNHDDGGNVRVHARALDNAICAGAEARAALALKDYDEEMGGASLEAAIQDYEAAKARFELYGLEKNSMWEHTHGAGNSLCYAVFGKCAAFLYQGSEKEKYKREALDWGRRLLECQEEKEEWGYFYRDKKKEHIVHFNHQAREKYYGECLVLLCKLAEEDKEKSLFCRSLKRYGDYLEMLMEHASPYRMFPAGLYDLREAEDREVFEKMNLLSQYEVCREDYREQIKQGQKMRNGKYLRQFPVWFSFRGNLNVQLSMAQSALETGIFLKRQVLIQSAQEQIHWLNGKNPFRQSLMTGNGKRYNELYAVFPGQCSGACPVGIQTKKNEDTPFWPGGNQATYREVWTSSTIKMMSICGKLLDY